MALSELTGEALGLTLLSILKDINSGFRSIPADYEPAKILVWLGLAAYADPYVEGRTYWLKITPAGRAALGEKDSE